MIPTSAKEIIRFTPSDSAPDAENPPVYLIAVPTVMQKKAYRRDVRAVPAFYIADTDMFNLLRDGIKAVVEDGAQAELLELVDSFESAKKTASAEAPIDDALAGDMTTLEDTISRRYSPYAQACADRDYWMGVAPLIACRHFLRGWENVATEFKQRGGLVGEDLLEQLPESHVMEIGWRAMALMSPTRADAKN